VEIISGKPYEDDGDIRTFYSNVDSDQLVWHRDLEDRKVTVLEGEGWQFQFNGSLPIELVEDRTFMIPRDMYHRVIKGKTRLVLRIEKI
jgi:quercetin dioxygenase-like cupin family protein